MFSFTNWQDSSSLSSWLKLDRAGFCSWPCKVSLQVGCIDLISSKHCWCLRYSGTQELSFTFFTMMKDIILLVAFLWWLKYSNIRNMNRIPCKSTEESYNFIVNKKGQCFTWFVIRVCAQMLQQVIYPSPVLEKFLISACIWFRLDAISGWGMQAVSQNSSNVILVKWLFNRCVWGPSEIRISSHVKLIQLNF